MDYNTLLAEVLEERRKRPVEDLSVADSGAVEADAAGDPLLRAYQDIFGKDNTSSNTGAMVDDPLLQAYRDIQDDVSMSEVSPATPDALENEDEGFISGIWKSGKQGLKRASNMAQTAWNVATGDDEDVARLAKEAAAIEQTSAQRRFAAELAQRRSDDTEDTSWWEKVKDITSAIISEPEGAFHEAVSTATMSLPVMGAMVAGGAGGSILAGGSAAATLLGSVGGLFLGNTALETGAIATEQAQSGQYDHGEALKAGLKKGAVITGVDALTMGLSKWMLGAPGKAAEKALFKTLADEGVDITSRKAVDTALKTNKDLAKKAFIAAKDAALKATPGKMAQGLQHTAAFGLETVGEGAGEALGSLAAFGEADISDAMLESIMSAGTSAGHVGLSKTYGSAKRVLNRTGQTDTTKVEVINKPINTGGNIQAVTGVDQDFADKEEQITEGPAPEQVTEGPQLPPTQPPGPGPEERLHAALGKLQERYELLNKAAEDARANGNSEMEKIAIAELQKINSELQQLRAQARQAEIEAQAADESRRSSPIQDPRQAPADYAAANRDRFQYFLEVTSTEPGTMAMANKFGWQFGKAKDANLRQAANIISEAHKTISMISKDPSSVKPEKINDVLYRLESLREVSQDGVQPGAQFNPLAMVHILSLNLNEILDRKKQVAQRVQQDMEQQKRVTAEIARRDTEKKLGKKLSAFEQRMAQKGDIASLPAPEKSDRGLTLGGKVIDPQTASEKAKNYRPSQPLTMLSPEDYTKATGGKIVAPDTRDIPLQGKKRTVGREAMDAALLEDLERGGKAGVLPNTPVTAAQEADIRKRYEMNKRRKAALELKRQADRQVTDEVRRARRNDVRAALDELPEELEQQSPREWRNFRDATPGETEGDVSTHGQTHAARRPIPLKDRRYSNKESAKRAIRKFGSPEKFRPVELTTGEWAIAPKRKTGTKYSLNKETTDTPVTIDTVKRELPNTNVTETDTGFEVTTPAGAKITITRDANIQVDPEVASRAYGREVGDEETAAGAFDLDGVISLAKGAGVKTLRHETYHAAEAMVLTDREIAAMEKRYGNAEQRAEAYANWDGHEPGGYFEKIRDFFRRIMHIIRPTAESTIREIKSGRVWNREAVRKRNQTPLGDLVIGQVDNDIQYQLDAQKWEAVPQQLDIFGTINNRLGKELEIIERLLGPLEKAEELPGKIDPKTGKRPPARSIRARDLGEALFAARDDGRLQRLVDPKINPETLADERGLTGTERKKFLDEVKDLRSGPLFLDVDAKGKRILSDNGKATALVDLILGFCQPTVPCQECYAAASMARMSTVRKALRNSIHIIVDPDHFGKRVAAEAKTYKKTQLPFIRLLGSGDLTSDEVVRAFNVLAQHADRPIHIFSRHHDNLRKLKGTKQAPFIKMGSLDSDLVKYYGIDYLKKNLRDYGINNAFLYRDVSDLPFIEQLIEEDALGLILSTGKDLHDGLPVEARRRSCPCDADERSYLGSCRQCALHYGGCFTAFADKAVDDQGNIWKLGDDGMPKTAGPMLAFFNNVKRKKQVDPVAESLSKVLYDVVGKSISLINTYQRYFKEGKSDRIAIKDIRWPNDVIYLVDQDAYIKKQKAKGKNLQVADLQSTDRVFYMPRKDVLSTVKSEIERLKSIQKLAIKEGTFYLPGGEIQKPVAYKGWKRLGAPELISDAEAKTNTYGFKEEVRNRKSSTTAPANLRMKNFADDAVRELNKISDRRVHLFDKDNPPPAHLNPASDAIIDGNDIWINTDRLSKPKDLIRFWLHEAVGHGKLRDWFDAVHPDGQAAFDSFLDKVWNLFKDDQSVIAPLRKNYASELAALETEQQRQRYIAEEIVAGRAENLSLGKRNLVINRFKALMNWLLKKLGIRDSFTKEDIDLLLERVKDAHLRRTNKQTRRAIRYMASAAQPVRYKKTALDAVTEEAFSNIHLSDDQSIMDQFKTTGKRIGDSLLNVFRPRNLQSNIFDRRAAMKLYEDQTDVPPELSAYTSFRLMSTASDMIGTIFHHGLPKYDQQSHWVTLEPMKGGLLAAAKMFKNGADYKIAKGRLLALSVKELLERADAKVMDEKFFQQEKRRLEKAINNTKDRKEKSRLKKELATMVAKRKDGKEAQRIASKLYGQDENGDWIDPRTKTAEILAATDQWYANNKNQFDQFINHLERYNKAVLEFAKQAGFVGDYELWSRSIYAPLNRVFEDHNEGILKEMFPTDPGENIVGSIKRLKGGKSNIADPMESLMANYSYIIEQSLKNISYTKFYGFFRGTDLVEANPKFDPAKGIPKDVVAFRVSGKRKYFRVKDKFLMESLIDLDNPFANHVVMKVLRSLKHLRTWSVTIAPAFQVANFIRDTLAAPLMGKGITPIIDSVKGLYAFYRHPELVNEALAAGGLFAGGYDKMSKTNISKTINRTRKGEWSEKNFIDPRRWWHEYQRLGRAAESANRLAIYQNLRAKGTSRAEAAFHAKDLMDFSLTGKGAITRFMVAYVPFLNARLQGIYKMGRAANPFQKDKAAAVRFWGGAALMTAASILLHAYNSELDDDRDEYNKLPWYQRWSYIYTPIKTQDGNRLKIPMPFEVGMMFFAAPAMIYETFVQQHATGEDMKRFVLHSLGQTLEINPAGSLDTIVDVWWTNRNSFTGQDIETPWDREKEPFERWDERTSKTARVLSKALKNAPFEGMKLSPKQIDHLIKQGGAFAGQISLLAIDQIVIPYIEDFPEDPATTVNQKFWLPSRLLAERKVQTPRVVGEYYDLMKELDQIYNTFNSLNKPGRKAEAKAYRDANKRKLQVRQQLSSHRQMLREINTRKKLIRQNRRLTPEEKLEKIRALNERRNMIITKLLKRVKDKLDN